MATTPDHDKTMVGLGSNMSGLSVVPSPDRADCTMMDDNERDQSPTRQKKPLLQHKC